MDEKKKAEITINYEKLFELLRREKGRDELQKLDSEFLSNFVEYLNNKLALLESSRKKQDIFSSADSAGTLTQIENIRRMMRELYERREKKIILMALNRSRTGSRIIDTSNLMEQDKSFFEELQASMDRYRKGILDRILSGKEPEIPELCTGRGEGPDAEKEEKEKKREKEQPKEGETKLLRFLKPVPRFVGKELETYGPFEEEDMANLPADIANVLIAKGRAEEMQG